MDDAERMGLRQCITSLPYVLEGERHRQRTVLQLFGQVVTVQPFHHDEGHAFDLSHVDHADHVLAAHLGDGSRFEREALGGSVAIRELGA